MAFYLSDVERPRASRVAGQTTSGNILQREAAVHIRYHVFWLCSGSMRGRPLASIICAMCVAVLCAHVNTEQRTE